MAIKYIDRNEIAANRTFYSKKNLEILPGGARKWSKLFTPDLWEGANRLARDVKKGAGMKTLEMDVKLLRQSLFNIRFFLDLPNSGNVGMDENWGAKPPFVSIQVNQGRGIKVWEGVAGEFGRIKSKRARKMDIGSLPEEIVKLAASMISEAKKEMDFHFREMHVM